MQTMSAVNVLCRLCRRTAGGNLHNWIDHHTEPALKLSAAKGCQVCRLLFLEFRQDKDVTAGRRERLRIARLSPDFVWVKGFNDAIVRFEVVGTGTRCIISTPQALTLCRVWIAKGRGLPRHPNVLPPHYHLAK